MNYDKFNFNKTDFINDTIIINNSAKTNLFYFYAIQSPNIDIIFFNFSILNCQAEEQVN